MPDVVYRYACECRKRHCGETLELRRAVWERLAKMGAVIHEGCLDGREALAAVGEARVVRTTMVGIRRTRNLV